jgi:hypothetical protein
MGDRSAEQRLSELGIELPAPPQTFGTYVEAVETGNLLFLSGMLAASCMASQAFRWARRSNRKSFSR